MNGKSFSCAVESSKTIRESNKRLNCSATIFSGNVRNCSIRVLKCDWIFLISTITKCYYNNYPFLYQNHYPKNISFSRLFFKGNSSKNAYTRIKSCVKNGCLSTLDNWLLRHGSGFCKFSLQNCLNSKRLGTSSRTI